MQSFRSRIIIALIRYRHFFRLKLKAEVINENFSVLDFREKIEVASKRMEKEIKNIKIEKANINGMNAEWIIPNGAKKDRVILYIHGGGFISGSCTSHRMHVAKFANESSCMALVFDYRLAPEHPFPAALDDSVNAYKWLIDLGYSSDNIVIAGESAGGSLTLSVLLALKSMNLNLPKAAVAISPATDLTCTAESFKINAKKDIAPINSWNVWTRYYIASSDVKNPLLSPLYGDLSGLPPISLTVGTNEIHLDDTVNFAKKAESYGVDVELNVWKGMVHAFPILSPLFPEAKRSLGAISDFIRNSLDIV